jgi:hypothetical protein
MKYYKILMACGLLISMSACLSENSGDDTDNGTTPTPTYGLQWSGSVSAGLVNSCIGPFSISLTDGNGNVVNAASNVAVYLNESSNDAETYMDANCNQEISTVTINQNTSSVTFYLKDDLVESFELDAEEGNADIEIPVSMNGESSTGDALVATNGSGGVDSCSGPVIFSVKNSSGGAVAAPADTDIQLSSSDDSVEFYKNSGCNESVSDITIDQGSSSVAVYYIGDNLGSFTINATSDIGNVNPTVSINSGTAANILMSGSSGSAGTCVPVTVTYTDIFNNSTINGSPFAATLFLETANSTNYGAYSDANCLNMFPPVVSDDGFVQQDSINIPAGSSFTFYLTEDTTDEMSVEIDPQSDLINSNSTTVNFQ